MTTVFKFTISLVYAVRYRKTANDKLRSGRFEEKKK